MKQNQFPPLNEFVELSEFHPSVARTFSTVQSLKWFVRRHRGALVEAGAVAIIAGRLRFHPARFQRVAVQIGMRAAA